MHTGQHYDDKMSHEFFDALDIPRADINLGIGSGTHAEQVGTTMMAFERVIQAEKPDWIVVVGDVNTTLACAVTAKKEQIKCCHIEAGMRSGDITMPEEINRLVTDRISDLLLTPDEKSSENLKNEGISDNKIKFVGNIMIDTLNNSIKKAEKLLITDIIIKNALSVNDIIIQGANELNDDKYVLVTFHRPANVDNPKVLIPIIDFLVNELSQDLKIIWPMHPRTIKQLNSFNCMDKVRDCQNIILLNPIGYLDRLRFNMQATIVFTDSGGLQSECCVLGTPCLTIRNSTEWKETLRENGGPCVLVGNEIDNIRSEYKKSVNQKREPFLPEGWDGHTAERCLEAVVNY